MVSACAGEVLDDDAVVHTDSPDSERHTDEADTPDTEPVDSEPPDSEPPETDAPAACDPATPTGTCPLDLVCREGACIDDLGAGGPAPVDAVASWHAAVDWLSSLDLHADRHPVPWSTVRDEVAALLPAASTEAEAAWWMTRGVARLLQGHTFLSPPALCDLDPGYSERLSDTGACLVEAGGELLVVAAAPGTPWRVGDVLRSLDGRSPEQLIADRLAQPRCRAEASTTASARALAVASMMFRDHQVEHATVRRADGAEEGFEVPYQGQFLRCDGRVPDPAEVSVGGDVRRRVVDGVTVLHLPAMGSNDGGFSDLPMILALRAQLGAMDPGEPLVIDLRGNRGGFATVPDAIASWMLTPGTVLRRCLDRSGHAPADRTEVHEVLASADPLAWTGPVAVVVDAVTYGAGAYLDLALRGRAVVVGQPSSGSYGISWRQPDGTLGAAVDGRRCLDEDDQPLEGTSRVDLQVEPTQAGLAAGRDEVLEAAVAALAGP